MKKYVFENMVRDSSKTCIDVKTIVGGSLVNDNCCLKSVPRPPPLSENGRGKLIKLQVLSFSSVMALLWFCSENHVSANKYISMSLLSLKSFNSWVFPVIDWPFQKQSVSLLFFGMKLFFVGGPNLPFLLVLFYLMCMNGLL